MNLAVAPVPVLPIGVARLRFGVVARDSLRLPFFAGSMLRGAYGHALRRLVCLTRAPACEGCSLRSTCPFPRLFEPFGSLVEQVGLSPGSARAAAPFAIDPPPMGAALVEAGETWAFEMRLFGRTGQDLGLVVEAWRRALASGLGREAARGDLRDVEMFTRDGWQPAFDAETGRLDPPPPDAAAELSPAGRRAELRFVTPLRLQSNARRVAVEDITARRLAADALRRARLVTAACGDAQARAQVAGWPVRLWLDEIGDARPRCDLRWVDWSRWSGRQRRGMTLGGWIGAAHIEACTPALSAALAIGARLGLGKETVFGMGRYELALS